MLYNKSRHSEAFALDTHFKNMPQVHAFAQLNVQYGTSLSAAVILLTYGRTRDT